MSRKLFNLRKGFTLVELIICLAIFALMTALIVAKYSSFNSGVLLTNLAYDIALTVRQAQSYGLNVRSRPVNISSPGTNFSGDYNYPYGVYIPEDEGNGKGKHIYFFADTYPLGSPDGLYTVAGNTVDDAGSDNGDVRISTYTFKNNFKLYDTCVGNGNACDPTLYPTALYVTFKRPDPTATITAAVVISGVATYTTFSYAEIIVQDPTYSPPTLKKIILRRNGQITITN